MISFLRGRVVEKTSASVVVDVGGVGYACGISASTAAALPAPGSAEECMLYVRMQVREDGASLFGFSTKEEREVFERLVAVSGVGPKIALCVLSSFSPETLGEIVASGDEKRMATVPGVGKKTASRLILELRDVFKENLFTAAARADSGKASASTSPAMEEASAALLSMGFSSAECELALKGFDGRADDTAAAVRYALRRMGSNS